MSLTIPKTYYSFGLIISQICLIIISLPQSDILHEMEIPRTYEKTHKSIQEVNTGKAPGLNGIPEEVLLDSGNEMPRRINDLNSVV